MVDKCSERTFMDHLLKHWHGAPIEVRIAGEAFLLGNGPAFTTIYFRNWAQLRQILRRPSLAFGEAYIRGEIEIDGELCDVLSGFCVGSVAISPWRRLVLSIASCIPTSIKRAVANARHHYDVGNDFFDLWLDPTRAYSCAYFENGSESLEEAQRNKFDLICRKLRLEPGNRLLDIGCGWGGLIFHAVENYGVIATGVTPANEQHCYVREEARRRGLVSLVHVVNTDWRGIEGQFDRVVSVGMFEHVGHKQYNHFLCKWHQLLREEGFSVLHTISSRLTTSIDPWIQRYIFPGGELPTLAQVARSATAADMRILRTENLRPHYARTLAAWADNFQKVRMTVVKKFGEEFTRMWWLYLQASQACFRWGDLDLLQFEFCGRHSELPLSRELPAGVCNHQFQKAEAPSESESRVRELVL